MNERLELMFADGWQGLCSGGNAPLLAACFVQAMHQPWFHRFRSVERNEALEPGPHATIGVGCGRRCDKPNLLRCVGVDEPVRLAREWVCEIVSRRTRHLVRKRVAGMAVELATV
jgi:hypothetical protein